MKTIVKLPAAVLRRPLVCSGICFFLLTTTSKMNQVDLCIEIFEDCSFVFLLFLRNSKWALLGKILIRLENEAGCRFRRKFAFLTEVWCLITLRRMSKPVGCCGYFCILSACYVLTSGRNRNRTVFHFLAIKHVKGNVRKQSLGVDAT